MSVEHYNIFEKKFNSIEWRRKLERDVKKIDSTCSQEFKFSNGKTQTVGVNTSYVQQALKKAEIIFVGYDGTEPVSFILADYKNDSFYIALICAKPGYGGKLLKEFLSYADEYNVNVSLSALVTVLKYYPKFGFEFRKSCKNNGVDYFSDIETLREVFAKEESINLENMTQEPFKKFLYELDDEDFLNYPGNEKGKCKRYKSDKGKLQCFSEQDGFTMYRCKTDNNTSIQNINSVLKPNVTRSRAKSKKSRLN